MRKEKIARTSKSPAIKNMICEMITKSALCNKAAIKSIINPIIPTTMNADQSEEEPSK